MRRPCQNIREPGQHTNEARVLLARSKGIRGIGLVADLKCRRLGHGVGAGMPLERHGVTNGGVCREGYVPENTACYVRLSNASRHYANGLTLDWERR